MNSDPESKPKKKRSASSKSATSNAAKQQRFTHLAPNTLKDRQYALLSFLIQVDIDRTEKSIEEEQEAPTNFMKTISVKNPPQKTDPKDTFIPAIIPKSNP